MHCYWIVSVLLALWPQHSLADCDATTTTTLSSTEDATALASCATYSGSVAVASGFSDTLDLDGIQEISGKLEARNVSSIRTLSSPTLQKILGDFTLGWLDSLANIEFKKLDTVGRMRFDTLPKLQSVGLDAGVDVASVDIVSTGIESLELNVKVADDIYVADNQKMNNISLGLNNIGNSLTIEANNPEVAVDFPSLSWANNITLRNVSDISMPRINFVNDSFGLIACSTKSLMVPGLSVINGMFGLVDNPDLGDVDLPALLSVGKLFVLDNAKIGTISFEQLAKINSHVTITGNVTNITMPALQSANGSFVIDSVEDFNCDPFDTYKTNNVIKREYVCFGHHTNSSLSPSASGAASHSTSSANPSSKNAGGLSTGAKAGIGIGISLAALALLGIGALLLLRRRKKSKQTILPMEKDGHESSGTEGGLSELDSETGLTAELGLGKEAQELPSHHGVSEAGTVVGAEKETEKKGIVEIPGTFEKE